MKRTRETAVKLLKSARLGEGELRKVFSYTLFLGVCSLVIPNISCADELPRLLNGSRYYYSVDDWEDMPLFVLSREIGIHDVQIWADGRVSWVHFYAKGGGSRHFKSNIPKEKVEEALQKIKAAFDVPLPVKRSHSVYCTEPFAHIVRRTQYTVFSHEIHVYHHWDQTIYDGYRAKREELKKLQTDDQQKFVSNLRSVSCDGAIGFLGAFFHQCGIDRDRRYVDITAEEYATAGRIFVAEAEFSILLEDIIKNLLPKEDNLVSAPVKRQEKSITVEGKMVDGKIVFEYKPKP